ncbi:MAG: DUF3050 domain-containing protein [Polyangiales bacterium]
MSAVDETSASSIYEARLRKALEPLHNALMNHAVYRRLSLRRDVASEAAFRRGSHGATNQSGEYLLGTAIAQATGRMPPMRPEQQHDSLQPLRTFMESHVFAVWDFMSLVKTLQQRLTCVRTPWQPPADATSARLINEIVLVEETDECGEGRYASHFELYVTAMEEVGANTRPIRTFLSALRAGSSVSAALSRTEIHTKTKAFAMNTMSTLNRETHEVAASFLLGRESVIPLMFEQVLDATAAIDAPTFNWYLKRHIEVDGEEHGPAGWRLLARLCGNDPIRWAEAEASAKRALYSRRALWDGVCESLESRTTAAAVAG